MDSTANMTPGLATGDKLLHFEVREQLASGGQGIVWKAYDALLDRSVAIKQIAEADVVDEAMRQKFRAEAELQKKVSTSSSHVVDVIDLVDDHRGLFIVMEFVEGQSLDRLLSSTHGPLQPIQALKIIRDVALGLAAIHKAGIVHRDLKPGNILLPADGSSAKICDFGLARLMDEQDVMSTGTVAYMAPELFGGDGADGRSDIYSLGMVSYEMVAGRPAFEQAFKAVLRDQRNQAMRWMKWHTNVRVTAPPLAELNEKAPARLTELIDRMMAKDPGQRIASAAQLVEAIARHFGKGAKQEQAAAAASTGGNGAAATAGAPVSSPMAALPTAALGKKKKWPMIVAAVVLFWTVVIGGVMFYRDYQAKQQLAAQQNEGMGEFTAATDAFRDEDWATAEQRFRALAERFKSHPMLGAESDVGAELAAAHLASQRGKALMSEGKFDEASAVYGDTYDKLDAIEVRVDDARETQHGVLFGLIRGLKDNLDIRRAFVSKAAEVDALAEAGKVQPARIAYDQLKKTEPVLLKAEKDKMEEIFGKIQGAAQETAIAEAKTEADKLIASRKFIEAEDFLEKAIEDYRSPLVLVETLATLKKDQAYASAIAGGDAAVNASDYPEAITQYQQADQIKPSADLKEKIAGLQLAYGLKQARAHLEKDETKLAEALLQDLIGRFPDNTEVKTLLAGIVAGKDFAGYVREGDDHLAAKRWQQAIGSYTLAVNLRPDADVQAKILDAKLGLTWDQAKAAAAARNLDEADRLCDAVLAIDPQHVGASRLKQQIVVQRRLGDDIKRAADLRSKGDYVGAKKILRELLEYAKSLQLPDTFIEDVTSQLNVVELDHLVQQIEGAMEAKDIQRAEATLDTAFSFAKRKNIKDDRLAKLLEVLDELKKKFG